MLIQCMMKVYALQRSYIVSMRSQKALCCFEYLCNFVCPYHLLDDAPQTKQNNMTMDMCHNSTHSQQTETETDKTLVALLAA